MQSPKIALFWETEKMLWVSEDASIHLPCHVSPRKIKTFSSILDKTCMKRKSLHTDQVCMTARLLLLSTGFPPLFSVFDYWFWLLGSIGPSKKILKNMQQWAILTETWFFSYSVEAHVPTVLIQNNSTVNS